MTDDATTALTSADSGRQLVAPSGAELVELSERFYRGLFVGAVAFVAMAAVASLVLLPARQSVQGGGPPVTVILTVLLAAVVPLAVWHADAVYRALRRWRVLEIALVVVAAALVAYPLRSELWWPSCALIIVLAIITPLRRALGYCLIVLLTNLAAHVIAGDLDETPAVSIIGLWIGYPFWAATFSIIGDRFASHVLRLPSPATAVLPPTRVQAWTTADPPSPDSPAGLAAEPDPPAAETVPVARGEAMGRLTARQLQVTALLVDGLRYAEVAACLSITERQVQRHVANAIGRAGVRTANELIAVAVAEGLVPAPPPSGDVRDGATPRDG